MAKATVEVRASMNIYTPQDMDVIIQSANPHPMGHREHPNLILDTNTNNRISVIHCLSKKILDVRNWWIWSKSNLPIPPTNNTEFSSMTSSNGNVSASLAICAGNSAVTGEFTAQMAGNAELWCFFDLHLNIWLGKQSWGCWFETLSHSLWRHCNDIFCI